MLSIDDTKKILKNPAMSDKEAEQIRDEFRFLVDIIFEKWMEDRKNKRLPNYETGLTRNNDKGEGATGQKTASDNLS